MDRSSAGTHAEAGWNPSVRRNRRRGSSQPRQKARPVPDGAIHREAHGFQTHQCRRAAVAAAKRIRASPRQRCGRGEPVDGRGRTRAASPSPVGDAVSRYILRTGGSWPRMRRAPQSPARAPDVKGPEGLPERGCRDSTARLWKPAAADRSAGARLDAKRARVCRQRPAEVPGGRPMALGPRKRTAPPWRRWQWFRRTRRREVPRPGPQPLRREAMLRWTTSARAPS
jgi:hypothetical protein